MEKIELTADGTCTISWKASTQENACIEFSGTPGTRHVDVVTVLGNLMLDMVLADIYNNRVSLEGARKFLDMSTDLEDRLLNFVERQSKLENEEIFKSLFPKL